MPASAWPPAALTSAEPGDQWVEVRDEERWLSRAHVYIRGDGSDVVELVHIETQPDLQRTGLATGVFATLFQALPGRRVTNPGGLDSDEGKRLIEHVRRLGMPLHAGCFMPGKPRCTCGLAL